MTVIDLFAGCGGWDVGARDLGIDPIGIEMDADACATRALHGMPTIRADLTTLDPLRFAGIDGLIASPPCQDWSMAGSRKGITGETGRLVMEVLRWATAIGPRWVACEQVPTALPVWEFFAHHLRDFGYKTWTGVLEAERYGVPQTRERAFLLAHRDHQPEPPVPTHQRYVSGEPARYEPASMFHAEILPWVSAAEACGWGRCDGTMEHQRGAGMAERHGDRDPRPIHAPAPTMTAGAGRRIKVDRWIDTRRDQRPDGSTQTRDCDAPAPALTAKAGGQWVIHTNNDSHQAGGETKRFERDVDAPAPTMTGQGRSWVFDRPTTTVACDPPPLPDFLHAESEPVRYSKDEDGPQGEPNMSTLTIDGWSDDLIHVRGDDFAEEYTAGSDDAGWLQFACGAVVQVVFDDEGRWRTSVILPAPGLTIESYYRAPIIDPDDRDYSDRLTVSGDNLLPVRYFDDISHIDDLFNSVPQEWS